MYAQVRDQRRSEVATKFDLEGEHDANEVGRSCRACSGTLVQVLPTHLKHAFEGLSRCQSQMFSAMTHFANRDSGCLRTNGEHSSSVAQIDER